MKSLLLSVSLFVFIAYGIPLSYINTYSCEGASNVGSPYFDSNLSITLDIVNESRTEPHSPIIIKGAVNEHREDMALFPAGGKSALRQTARASQLT